MFPISAIGFEMLTTNNTILVVDRDHYTIYHLNSGYLLLLHLRQTRPVCLLLNGFPWRLLYEVNT